MPMLFEALIMPLFCCRTPHFLKRSRKPGQAQVVATSDSSQARQPVLAAQDVSTLAETPSSSRPGNERPDLVFRQSSILWTKPLPQLPPPHMALSGKIALVTGGARGIGAGIALKLAKDGARVALTFHQSSSVRKAHAVIASIEAAGSSATAIQADVSKDPEKVVKHVLKAFGIDKLDILVNNAGAPLNASLEGTDPQDYDHVFDTNAKAVFFMMRAVKPYLAPGGRIINLSASAAKGGEAGSMAFAGSKAAVEAFTRVAAKEFGEMRKGITVNCVSPGMVRTEDYETVSEDVRAETALATPAGERLGSVEDVADVVAFVAGEGARWITGAVIPVNGGKMMM